MKHTYLVAFVATCISPYSAADDSGYEHDLTIEEIVVTASPVHSDSEKVIQGISILSGDNLRESAAATLGETLNSELGISSTAFGPSVGAPVIRGQSANRVKVMQDSLDTLDASNASPDHAPSIETLLAERIEILRGPATLRFGNGAIGGVVNVIDKRIPTKLSDDISGAIEIRHASVNDQTNNVVSVDGSHNNWAWHVDGLYRGSNNVQIPGYANEPHDDEESSHGFIGNSNSRTSSGNAGISWIGNTGFIGVSVNHTNNNYGIPPGAHQHHDDENNNDEEEEHTDVIARIDMQQTRYDLKAQLVNPFSGFNKMDIRFAHNDYEHLELEGAEVGTRFLNKAWEGRVELIHNPWQIVDNEWQGAIGIQAQQRDFSALGVEAFIPQSDIHNYGIFWIEDMEQDDWHFELGVRTEYQEINAKDNSTVDHNTSTLSAAMQYYFNDEQRASISMTRAERAPSVEELFANGPHLATASFDIGNPDLDVETSDNFEFGYQHQNYFDFTFFAFYNRISDFIYAQQTGNIDSDSELNIFKYEQKDAVFYGAEAELSIPLNEVIKLSLFADVVRAKFQNHGGDVPRITPPRYGIETQYEDNQWRANLRVTRVNPQTHVGDSEDKTDGFIDLSANVNYDFESVDLDWVIFLRATNLLDREMRNATSYLRDIAPQAGRNIELGIRTFF